MKKRTAILAIILIVCSLLGMTACSSNGNDKASLSITVEPPKAAADYDEVSKALRASSEENSAWGTNTMAYESDGALKESSAPEVAADAPDYSGTNVQVAGIDEADIIKTDGKYIYAMFGNMLKIYRADGANTALVSESTLKESTENESFYASEMYLENGKLFVMTQCSSWGDDEVAWYWNSSTEIEVYDISDPAQPKLIEAYGQDGDYVSSRLADGKIYLISQNYIYDELDGEEWIPCTYCGGKEAMIPANRIYICPSASGSCLTLVAMYDCETLTVSDVCSFTGSADTVYMNGNDIYLAYTSYQQTESEPYTVDQYQVVDYQNGAMTAINRVTAEDGKLTLTASGSVEGCLVNQFAIDAYNDTLRVATTVNSYEYSVYTDEKYEFTNTKWGDQKLENTVTVLDADLQPVGSLGGIAPDEQIYSVRYFGDIVYVVTYESIDPVFAIDLSDPANPTMLSALEVLGVSDYLQGYGDGLLFGLGRALDEDGVSDGIQLSMFDISDPKDVKLITKTVVDEWYSDALYDHKAILISTEKNLIGFPGNDSNYYIFSYTEGKFVQKGSFDLVADESVTYWSWGTTRGLYIGNYLYMLCDEAFCVVDMNDFTVVKQISNAEG